MSVIIGVSMGLVLFACIIVGIVTIKPLNPKEDGVIADGEGNSSVEGDNNTKSPKSNASSSKNNSISAHGLAGHLAGVTAGEYYIYACSLSRRFHRSDFLSSGNRVKGNYCTHKFIIQDILDAMTPLGI